MKSLYWLLIGFTLVACAEKKPLTPEEQWHGYCTSMGNAGRSILLDRQNGIEQVQAIEHANKIGDEFTRKFILSVIDQVYALPINQVKEKPEEIREQFKQKIMEECLVTPHDKMPNYKPF